MLEEYSPLNRLRSRLLSGEQTPLQVAKDVVLRANGNRSRNTYIHLDANELKCEAAALAQRFPSSEKPPLYGVPISLKDCFDLTGATTTCGSRFYAEQHAIAKEDSSMALRLRQAGALITGKTHLHPLAYGITGQNPDYGDCLQPRDASVLTGGSSSGAAGSVQEGSALAAIGTDTGGSIRVPAALCGLVGYRASHALAAPDGWWPNAWRGASHLASSFDTVGFLLRDPRDAVEIAHAVFGVPLCYPESRTLRIGCVNNSFLHDCAPEVMNAFQQWKENLANFGADVNEFIPDTWSDTLEIFAGIQAHEAADIHRGNYDHFEPAIRDRMRWGASLTEEVLEGLHLRRKHFRESMASLFLRFDFLMLPSAPVSRLPSDADLSNARQTILRYTTPFSLVGLPAITLPGEITGVSQGAAFRTNLGTGVQIAGPPGEDPRLLAFARSIGEWLVQKQR